MFMEGLISIEWKLVQQSHYDAVKSHPQGQVWANRLIREVWNISHSIWNERNDRLHNTISIQINSGLSQLKAAIRKEWKIGLSTLPHCDFSYLLRQPLHRLLQRSVEAMKEWFSTVRRGREVFKDPWLLKDNFTRNKALRTWVGLPPIHHQ